MNNDVKNLVISEVRKFPETEKLVSWFQNEKARGLQDVKAFPWLDPETTPEIFCGSVNAILSGQEVPHHPGLFE